METMSPRCIAARAKTMDRELVSSTKVLVLVTGMFNTSWGYGPTTAASLKSRNVAMSEPKNRHSEAKNVHINNLRWSNPVVVSR
jgi:hypothetical protein